MCMMCVVCVCMWFVYGVCVCGMCFVCVVYICEYMVCVWCMIYVCSWWRFAVILGPQEGKAGE